MTLQEIFSFVNQSLRFKLHPDQFPIIVDIAQKLAFDQDMEAFLVTDQELTIYHELHFATGAAYIDAVSGDIGLTVNGGTKGAGTLISYNNATRVWVIQIDVDDNEFVADDGITISGGTGAGTLKSSDFQKTHRGPYSFPTSPPVRKMWGVTTIKDTRIFGTEYTYLSDRDDYGLDLARFDERRFFENFRMDRMAETLTFVNAPSDTSANTDTVYRWWYFRNPPKILDILDNDNLLIPDMFHMNLVQMCIKIANINTEDGIMDRQDIEQHWRYYWEHLWKNYTPQGRGSTHFNEGSLP